MSNEETIKKLERLIISENGKGNIGVPVMIKDLKVVLDMLKGKDNIIEGKECVIETQVHNEEVLLNTLKKKDKMIDLMAECILNLDNEEEICTKVEDSCYDFAGQNGKTCDTCIKQYFERKAE